MRQIDGALHVFWEWFPKNTKNIKIRSSENKMWSTRWSSKQILSTKFVLAAYQLVNFYFIWIQIKS